MAVKACLPLVRVVAHKPLHLFPGVVVVARLSPIEEKRHGAPRRMAQRKKDVSDLPYTASPLSCVAFFVKEQVRSSQQAAERGTLLVVISNLE